VSTSIAEKEAELRHTQQLINERIRQAEIALVQLRRVNNLLEQFVIMEHDHRNTKN
jgi:hypothetical protein